MVQQVNFRKHACMGIITIYEWRNASHRITSSKLTTDLHLLALFNTSGINVNLNRRSGDIHSNPLKKLCKQPRTPVVRTDRPSIITPQNSLDISYGSLE